MQANAVISGGRVLLAEDDSDLRAQVASALRRDGHGVIEAEDGYELADLVELSIYRKGLRPRPDVIVSEMCLPGVSALLILEQLRGEHMDTPMILMAPIVDDAARSHALDLGATAVFDRTSGMDSLCRFVARVVGARRALDARGPRR